MSEAIQREHEILIENVVASGGIKQELNLQSVAMDLSHSEYDPDSFPGIKYKVKDVGATALIFRTGKIVATGADSVDDAERAIDSSVKNLETLGIEATQRPTVIQNIVSCADLGCALNLNAIAIGLGLEQVEYEPEQFPGLVYRSDDHDCVILLFGSGKCVITGVQQIDTAYDCLEGVERELDGLGMLS